MHVPAVVPDLVQTQVQHLLHRQDQKHEQRHVGKRSDRGKAKKNVGACNVQGRIVEMVWCRLHMNEGGGAPAFTAHVRRLFTN